MKNLYFLTIALMFGLVFGIGNPSMAAIDDTLPPVVKGEKSGIYTPDRHITITRGKSKVIKVDANIADVLVADPSVIEVGAMKSDRLYLIGAALGDTNVMIFDGEGNAIEQLDVHVRVDEVTLQNTLKSLFPDEKIIAKTVNDDIMLTGNASNPCCCGADTTSCCPLCRSGRGGGKYDVCSRRTTGHVKG